MCFAPFGNRGGIILIFAPYSSIRVIIGRVPAETLWDPEEAMAKSWRITLILAMGSLALGWFTLRAYAEPGQRSHSRGSVVRLAKPSPRRSIETTSQGNSNLIRGVWGGEHIRLEVTDAGAIVEYDCAHATIFQKIMPDRSGHFVVNGVYVPEHGGPVRTNEQPINVRVSFTGQVRSQSMSLTMRRRDTRKLMGHFALRYGQEGELIKCR